MQRTKITIAIITLNHQESLLRTLLSLSDTIKIADTEIEVLVVDNDAEGTSKHVVSKVSDQYPFSIRYVIEKNRGRGFARNAALEHTKESDYIVFVDDDVIVESDWLKILYETSLREKAQMVSAHATFIFPQGCAEWAKECSFFRDTEFYEDTNRNRTFSTMRLFIDRKWVEKNSISFPEQIAGEDTVFTYEASLKGAKLVKSMQSRVSTFVDPSRIKFSWVLKRGISNAANRNGIYRRHYSFFKMFGLSFLEVLRSLCYAFGAALLCLMGKRPYIRMLEHFSVAIGWFWGLLGLNKIIVNNS